MQAARVCWVGATKYYPTQCIRGPHQNLTPPGAESWRSRSSIWHAGSQLGHTTNGILPLGFHGLDGVPSRPVPFLCGYQQTRSISASARETTFDERSSFFSALRPNNSPYSITSPAQARIDGGMVRPSLNEPQTFRRKGFYGTACSPSWSGTSGEAYALCRLPISPSVPDLQRRVDDELAAELREALSRGRLQWRRSCRSPMPPAATSRGWFGAI